MELFRPRGASQPRRATDNNQQNGQITNPPRFAEMGGLSAPNKYIGGKNKMQIKPPGDGKRVI